MDEKRNGAIELKTHGPDFKWVLAARAGYPLAYDELVSRYEERVYRLALSIARDPKLAESVLQNTFAKAREHLDEFRGDCQFSTWLLGIAKKEAMAKLGEERGDGKGPSSLEGA
jgi:RNA polymerase sigma-70 factor, ECF subfamily